MQKQPVHIELVSDSADEYGIEIHIADCPPIFVHLTLEQMETVVEQFAQSAIVFAQKVLTQPDYVLH